MSRWRSTADFLALRRNPVLLLVALVLAGRGERLWPGFAPKHLMRDTVVTGGSLLGARLWSSTFWPPNPPDGSSIEGPFAVTAIANERTSNRRCREA